MKKSLSLMIIALITLILGAAVARTQEKPQIFGEQGKKLMEAGQHLQAAEAHKKAIRLQPGLEEAHLGLKEAYGGLSHRQQIDEAHRLLKELPPDDAVGHYGLGLLYVQKGDLGYAQDEYQIIQNLDPTLAQRLYQAIYPRK